MFAMSEPNTTERLAEALCRLLPQTQCRQCGFDGCAQYARAIAEDRAEINRCAPGGKKGVEKLAALTGHPALEIDSEYGRELPFAVARIDPKRCIGCRLCQQRLPRWGRFRTAQASFCRHRILLHGLRSVRMRVPCQRG